MKEQWVKIEDDLPELYKEVWLSCRAYKKVVIGYLAPDYHKSWCVDNEYFNINKANAWMYVERPTPYQECEEREPILDKIREEIKALSPEPTAFDVVDGNPVKTAIWGIIEDVLEIIDKYKECEEK